MIGPNEPNTDAGVYEIDIRREISMDFLEEAHGAVYQARIQRLAYDLKEEGYDLTVRLRFGIGSVSLVLIADEPTPLDALTRAAAEKGYELPEPDHRLAQSPEELDRLRQALVDPVPDRPQAEVVHRMSARMSLGLASAIRELMAGTLISSHAGADLKSFASDLSEAALGRARLDRQAGPSTNTYEEWAIRAATELTFKTGLDLDAAEKELLEQLAPHEDPMDPGLYLTGYPEYLVHPNHEGPEPATRNLLWCLFVAAWNKSAFSAADVFCGAEPQSDPYAIGLYGTNKRKLAFYAHPDPTELACATRDDLVSLHERITHLIATTADP